jgi:multicomponent Na+:H+ antiporter subunit G
MDWNEVLIVALMAVGAAFMLLGAIGAVRMPDIYLRMSATSKAATLGAGLFLGAAALHFGDFATTCRCLAAVLFLFHTAPVAAHMLGRSAYRGREPLWQRTHTDQLAGCYDLERDHLRSAPVAAAHSGAAAPAAPAAGPESRDPEPRP